NSCSRSGGSPFPNGLRSTFCSENTLTTAGLACSTATTTGVRRGLCAVGGAASASRARKPAIMNKKSGAYPHTLSTLTHSVAILTLAAAPTMSTAAKRDYYEILGVARTAAGDEIKKAYRKL